MVVVGLNGSKMTDYDEVHGVAWVVRVKWCTHLITFDHLKVEADFTAKSLQRGIRQQFLQSHIDFLQNPAGLLGAPIYIQSPFYFKIKRAIYREAA